MITRITPTDFSREAVASNHNDIGDYANAITDVDSTTYGTWFSYMSGVYTYLIFTGVTLPESIATASFRIKACAHTASAGYYADVSITLKGVTTPYVSDKITISTTTPTIYDLPLPSGVSPSALKTAKQIVIRFTPTGASNRNLDVYGSELDISDEHPKIFNLILPRG